MNHTKNYGLPQWELNDLIRMEDFNAMNNSIEAGLDSNAAAAASAVNTANFAKSTATAAQQAGQLMDEAQREAAALKRRAEQDIEAERRKAAMELKGDISELALTLAGKVVEKELDPSTQQSLIDGFLDDLGDLS